MRILQMAGEAVPFAKTGGLGDVVGALSRHLARLGHEIQLCIPLYREVRAGGFEPGPSLASLGPGELGIDATARIRSLSGGPEGVRALAVEAPNLFDRDGLYWADGSDFPDNLRRFTVFARACLAGAAAGGRAPDLVHVHDWQAALAAVLLRYAPPPGWPGAEPAPCVLTVHNLAYQGRFGGEEWGRTGLPSSLFRPDLLEYYGDVNLLKGGLLSADRVTTVSPRYAREIATPGFGCGLDGVIAGLEPPVVGIMNGIDVETWDPASDPFLPAGYDLSDLSGKAAAKRALQEEMGLRIDAATPVFGMVGRLVDQKGLALLDELRDRLPAWPAQFVLVGTGEPRWEDLLRALDVASSNVAARVVFSERLAHRVEAGADFFLMPSAFEPCGLNQMISQRYGTVPVVHRVGGLADSVVHADAGAIAAKRATGIVFEIFDAGGLAWAIERALELWRSPDEMRAVMRAGMEADFSWDASARRYEALYRELLGVPRPES